MTVMGISKLGSGAALLFILSACGGTVNTGGGDGQSSSSSGSGTSVPCGGGACAAGEFCAYPDRQCKGSAGDPICATRPEVCDDQYAPACGCDGKVYPNTCSANAAGVDVGGDKCAPPSGYFSCGGLFCPINTDYCEHRFSDVGGEPASSRCQTLPASCVGKKADCACAASAPCGDMCKATPDGGIELICPGG